METLAKYSSQFVKGKMLFDNITLQLKQIFSPKMDRLNADVVALKKKKEKDVVIFLVDDDPLFLKALEHSISSSLSSTKIYTFQTGEASLQQMHLKPSIIILDYYLNSGLPYAWNGLDILKQVKKLSSKTK